MLNTISGGSVFPRDIIQWLDSLDLSYSVRNPKMDLANGFTIAEILTRKFPNQISILTYYNAQAKDKKYNNWEQLKKFLSKKNFKITKEQIDSIINLQPQTAQSFLFRIYELVTQRKLNIDRRLTSTLPQPSQPLYKKPTASYIAKDRELQRVIDLRQKQFRTKTFISKHQNHIHAQKYNTGLIEWLIEKRKAEIHNEVEKQRMQLQKKTKNMSNQQRIEVKEIQLKCFNSSTSKKAKGQFGDFLDNKGVLQFLTQSCSLLFKRQSIINDMKKLNIELRDKQISGNIIQDLFTRCDEQDHKGNTKLSSENLVRILEQFKKTSELNLIMDNINSNYYDYKKFFMLFEKPLLYYSKQSQPFKLILLLFSLIAKGLHNKFSHRSDNVELMFYEIFLPILLKIGQNEHKRPLIAVLILDFIRKESQCYFQLVQKVKNIYGNNIKVFSSYLALFIEKIAKQCDDIQYTLWNQFFYYSFVALNSTSPHTRVNGAKIISCLFSQVIVVSSEIINEKLPILQKLILDPWWQVRAQGLIIFKSILLSKFKNSSLSKSVQSNENINDDLNIKTIHHYIKEIFKPDLSHNILRIGLIELAQLLNFEESFCERYLDILLHVGGQIRNDILTTSIIKLGPVVYGSNTYNYQLTGAPLVWNSLGIAKALKDYIKKNNVNIFNLAHLEILYACICKCSTISKNAQDWLKLYEQIKAMIFESLLQQGLCILGLNIIKQFLSISSIHSEILSHSRGQIIRILNKIYFKSTQNNRKVQTENILQLFSYLKAEQSEYTYKILKDFAEREKDKYLSSNLIDFMNELSRERRKLLFSE